MTFRFLLLCASFMLVLPSTVRADEPPVVDQRLWMVNLVEGLGWSFGLPEEPEEEDYLGILGGGRHFRIEAEEAKRSTDMVSVKSFTNFGAFSGSGWVSGIATPTTAHFDFVLPIGGTYRLSAALRLSGHRFIVGGKNLAADGEEAFTEVGLGQLELPPGPLEIVAEIPPNGSIDYLELKAPNLPPIAPLGGWDPDAPLHWEDLAVTLVRCLELESLLPPGSLELIVEAETALPQENVGFTTARHLGAPSAGGWVRAETAEADFTLPFRVTREGVYSLLLRGAAERTVTGELDDRHSLHLEFPSYLEERFGGAFHLSSGPHLLQLLLPPRGGVDRMTLSAHRSDPADYLLLAGIDPPPDPPGLADLNRLLGLLAAIGVPR